MRLPFLLGCILLLCATNVFSSNAAQIPWETSLEAAKARAQQENKPILLLHVFGRLDQEFT